MTNLTIEQKKLELSELLTKLSIENGVYDIGDTFTEGLWKWLEALLRKSREETVRECIKLVKEYVCINGCRECGGDEMIQYPTELLEKLRTIDKKEEDEAS